VIDRTNQLIPVTLGGGGFAGQALPALLSGPSQRVPRLNARLVLGKTGLCPANPCADHNIAPAPQVLVVIPATGAERRRYGAAVTQMLEAMLPAGVRLVLRWNAWRGVRAAVPEDVIAIADAPQPLRLGEGQALGAANLGGRRTPRLAADGVTPVPHPLV
jgi:hypothetical protein